MLIETQIRLVSGASFCHLHMTSTCTKGFCSATRHSLTKERQSSTWGVHLPFKAKINKRATCTSFIRVTPEMDSLLTSKWERAWGFNLGTQVSREVRRVLIILNGQHSLAPALFQQRQVHLVSTKPVKLGAGAGRLTRSISIACRLFKVKPHSDLQQQKF